MKAAPRARGRGLSRLQGRGAREGGKRQGMAHKADLHEAADETAPALGHDVAQEREKNGRRAADRDARQGAQSEQLPAVQLRHSVRTSRVAAEIGER